MTDLLVMSFTFEFDAVLILNSILKKLDTNEVPPKQYWKNMIELIPNPMYIVGGRDIYQKTIPRILVVVSGERDPKKKELMNRALKAWQLNLKKTKWKEGECPYYAPGVQNMRLRAFFSKVREVYDFRYTLSEFKKWDGSLGWALKNAYEARRKEWVSICTILLEKHRMQLIQCINSIY